VSRRTTFRAYDAKATKRPSAESPGAPSCTILHVPGQAGQAQVGASHDGQEEILRRMQAATNYNAWLIDRARPFLGDRVLDAGAGTGTFTELAADGRELVIALEPDAAFADDLERRFDGRSNVVVLRAGTDELEPDAVPEAPDTILCFNVLEHIPDDRDAVARFARVAATGAHLLLLVPAHRRLFGSIDRTVNHERRYGKREVGDLLQAAGFELVDLRYVNPLGALGWLVSARLLRRTYIPKGSLRLYDRIVPLLRALDRVDVGFGLSVWAVGRRAG